MLCIDIIISGEANPSRLGDPGFDSHNSDIHITFSRFALFTKPSNLFGKILVITYLMFSVK